MLFPDCCQHDFALMRLPAKFGEIDRLPCAEQQATGGKGNCQCASRHHRFDMGGHIVGPLAIVFVAITLRRAPVQPPQQVALNRGVGILANQQARAGMATKQREGASGDPGLIQPSLHVARNVRQALSRRSDMQSSVRDSDAQSASPNVRRAAFK